MAAPSQNVHAAVQFESATQTSGTRNSNHPYDITIPIPSGTSSGDLLLTAISVRWYQATVTAPAGWTLIEDTGQSSGAGTCYSGSTAGIRTLTYYKIAGSSESTPTFTYSSNCNDDGFAAAGMLRISGVDSANPIVASGEDTTNYDTSHTAPSIDSGSETDTLLVTVHSYGSSRSWTGSPAGMTERVDQRSYGNDNNLGTTLGVFTQAISTAGNTGSKTATGEGSSDNGATQSILLRAMDSSASALTYYRMEEDAWSGSSGEVTDNSGNGYNATSVNGATTDNTDPAIPASPGTCGYGYFDGNDDYVALPSSFPNLDSSFTVSAWIKADSLGGDQRIFVDDQNNSGGFAFSLNDGGDGRLRFFSRGVSPVILDTGVVITTGQWYFVSAVHDASTGTRRIYVDGQLEASDTYSGTWGTDNGMAAIGVEPDGSSESSSRWRFHGSIDEVSIYQRALNQSEIQTLMANTHTCPVTTGASCEQIFPSALQNSSSSGSIEFGWDAQVSDPDNALESTNPIQFYPWADDTCQSTDCSATGTPSAVPQLESFQTSSGSTDINLGWRDDYTLGSGGINEYDSISGGGRSTISDGGGQSAYHINTLTLNWRDELILRGGVDYWIENLEFDSSRNNIEVVGGGTARLFIGNAADFSWETDINANGDPEELLIVGYDDLTFSNGDADDLNAVIYADGDLTFTDDNIDLTGSIAASGDIYLGWRSDVDYDSSAITNLDDRGFCGGTGPAVDHYTISHSGQGLTCEAAPITITAHDDQHAAVAPETTITISTTPAADSWALKSGTGANFTDLGSGQASYTFASGENTVELWLTETTATPSIDIDVNDGTVGESASEDPLIAFVDTAFEFYADSTADDIGTQIAGKRSDIAPGSQTLSLRAVQTNTDTGACEARLSGVQTVELAFECVTPSSCATANGVSISGSNISGNTSGAVNSYSNVDLDFGTNGTATFTLNYDDAGQIALHASKDIPASGEDPAITLSGQSNTFTVKPAGLCVESTDTNAACAATDRDGDSDIDNEDYALCSPFVAAGDNFNLTVRAVGWDGGGETDTDFCSGNATTPNFQLDNMDIGHDLIAPGGGESGTIDVASFNMTASDNGSHTISQSISEVGVFTFTATPPSYFGESIAASTSSNIGRFYPHHFTTATTNGDFANEHTAGGTDFTYLGEGFSYGVQPTVTATAKNAAGTTTENYTGAFAKLDTGGLSLNYPTDDNTAHGTDGNPLGVSVTSTSLGRTDNGDGSLTFTLGGGASDDTFTYLRNHGLITPFTPDLTIELSAVSDSEASANDLTTAKEIKPGGNNLQRYGRATLGDTVREGTTNGTTAAVPLVFEYYDGADFVTNSDDTTSSVAHTAGTPAFYCLDPDTGDTLACANVDIADTTATNGASFPFSLNSDIGDEGGTLVYKLRNSVVDDWLEFNWDGDTTSDTSDDAGNLTNPGTDHATASVTFAPPSHYHGDERFIYWREQIK